MYAISVSKGLFQRSQHSNRVPSLDLNAQPTCEAAPQGQTDCVEWRSRVRNRSASITSLLIPDS